MTMLPRTLGLLLATAVCGGCLEVDKTHTIYLEADGSVTWTVLERDVHSSAKEPEDRIRQESGYLDAARAGEHASAEGLAALAPDRLHSQVLRSRRPFAVTTEARFLRVEQPVEAILEHLGAGGWVEVEEEGDLVRLRVVLWPDEPCLRCDEDEAVAGLFMDSERIELVLAEGRFVEAVGFVLEESDRVAVPLEDGEAPRRPDGSMVLELAWQR